MEQPNHKLREYKKLQTHENLYQSALHLFSCQGYENTSISEITNLAGTAKGTFFNYFTSKADVIAEWYISALSVNTSFVPTSLKNTLSTIVADRLKVLQAHPELLAAKILCENSSESIIKAEELVDNKVRNLVLEALAKDEAAQGGFTVPKEDIADITVVVLTGAARAWRYTDKTKELSKFVEAQVRTLLVLIQASHR